MIETLDPLKLDDWFAAGPPLAQRRPIEVHRELHRIVATAPLTPTVAEAQACLRDVDLLLCRVDRDEPGSYRETEGLEELLLHFGETADHMPRACNHEYGVVNPL